MFKRLSLMMVGALVVAFCGAIAADKGEAASIKCSGKHRHACEWGVASCKGPTNSSQSFKTSGGGCQTPKYNVYFGDLTSGNYKITVKGSYPCKDPSRTTPNIYLATWNTSANVTLNY